MGLGEILIILVIALIIFGPDDLPDIARKLGKIVYQVRKSMNEMSKEFKDAMDTPSNVLNKALEQSVSTSSRGGKRTADASPDEESKEKTEGEKAKDGSEKDETLDEVLLKDKVLLKDEELLKYEDEESGPEDSSVEDNSSRDPLSKLPPDMVSYEEKGASR